jgi:hypothetical protein
MEASLFVFVRLMVSLFCEGDQLDFSKSSAAFGAWTLDPSDSCGPWFGQRMRVRHGHKRGQGFRAAFRSGKATED